MGCRYIHSSLGCFQLFAAKFLLFPGETAAIHFPSFLLSGGCRCPDNEFCKIFTTHSYPDLRSRLQGHFLREAASPKSPAICLIPVLFLCSPGLLAVVPANLVGSTLKPRPACSHLPHLCHHLGSGHQLLSPELSPRSHHWSPSFCSLLSSPQICP